MPRNLGQGTKFSINLQSNTLEMNTFYAVIMSIIATSITKSLLDDTFKLSVYFIHVQVSQVSQDRYSNIKGSRTSHAHFTKSCKIFKDNPAVDMGVETMSIFIKVSFVLLIHVEVKFWVGFCCQPHQSRIIIKKKQENQHDIYRNANFLSASEAKMRLIL